MKAILRPVAGFLSSIVLWQAAQAQLPYTQSFKNATATGVFLSGNARLTAASGVDPEGDGYLRLTENGTNLVGYAYAKDAFPSNYGLTTTFEFYTYKPTATGFNQADGISFFLFDASVNAFRPGGIGGSLGYAAYYGTPGMTKGYLGIGIDEYGNFLNPTEGRNGGPGRLPVSVVVRGPGDGKKATDYPYITSVQTESAPYNITFNKFTQRYPDPTSPNYRRIKIVLTPGSSLGTDKGFTITVSMFRGGSPGTEVPLITNHDYPYLAPARLQYGFAAATGANTNFHEIRNLNIIATNGAALLVPSAGNDSVAVCQGPKALLDVTANDVSNNTGGSINKATIDLNPATAGVQTSFTDPGKGTYSVDQYGIVAFTPTSGFIGSSVIDYAVSDTYGKTSANASIKVTVSSLLGPSLTVSNPAGVCAPAVVDITQPSLRSNTTAGATYDYFSSLTNANNNVASIAATAHALTTSGLYFIRANDGVCYNVQPVAVQVSAVPTTANAGTGQNLCTPGTTSLTGNDPLVGSGVWTQMGGPSAASFTASNFAVTSVSNLQRGSYTFRWSIANGACATSNSDVVINVANAAVAGSNQTLPNTATSTTLQANDPSPGTGMWTQTAGPAASIQSPTNAQTTINGLTAGKNYTFRWTVTNGCSTNSSMNVTVTALLPVQWLQFTASKQAGGVGLQWKTASETGNSHFVVERSYNAHEFIPLATVPGQRSMANEHAYTYMDGEVAGSAKTVFYRLQQVDVGGKSSYSRVAKVDLDTESGAALAVWPNPYHEGFTLTLPFASAGEATIRLYDQAGRLVLQEQRLVNRGANSMAVQPASSSAKGVYIVEVQKGTELFRQKLVKE